MVKYAETGIVFREFPDEVTLAINLSNCPHRCKGCHSPHLQQDIGTELTEEKLSELIDHYKDRITCVGFMGGDADIEGLVSLMSFVRMKHPKLNIGWYSGYDDLKGVTDEDTLSWLENCLDYLKLGPYIEKLGGLDKKTTNQKLFKRTVGNSWQWIPMYK